MFSNGIRGGGEGLLPDPRNIAAQRLRQLMNAQNNPMLAAAMASGDHQAYNMAVASAFNQLQQEFGPTMGADFDPHAIFKLATGADLNSAMHAADLVPNQERGYADPADLGFGGWDFKMANPTNPAAQNSGSMLEMYGFDPKAGEGPVMRRLEKNKEKSGLPEW